MAWTLTAPIKTGPSEWSMALPGLPLAPHRSLDKGLRQQF